MSAMQGPRPIEQRSVNRAPHMRARANVVARELAAGGIPGGVAASVSVRERTYAVAGCQSRPSYVWQRPDSPSYCMLQ